MDPMSVDRLFHLLAGVVDVITSIAAVLLVAVLTSRLRRRPVSTSRSVTFPVTPSGQRSRSSQMLPGLSQPSVNRSTQNWQDDAGVVQWSGRSRQGPTGT